MNLLCKFNISGNILITKGNIINSNSGQCPSPKLSKDIKNSSILYAEFSIGLASKTYENYLRNKGEIQNLKKNSKEKNNKSAEFFNSIWTKSIKIHFCCNKDSSLFSFSMEKNSKNMIFVDFEDNFIKEENLYCKFDDFSIEKGFFVSEKKIACFNENSNSLKEISFNGIDYFKIKSKKNFIEKNGYNKYVFFTVFFLVVFLLIVLILLFFKKKFKANKQIYFEDE